MKFCLCRSRSASTRGLLLSCLLLASGCGIASAPREIAHDPARASSFDIVEEDGNLHLLFGQAEGENQTSPTFFHARSTDAGISWSDPVEIPVAHAPPGNHSRGNDPQLAVSGDRILAVWTAKGEGPWGSGPLGTAVSNDGGRTWSAAPSPVLARANEGAGFRFPAIAPDKSGFHAVWIHAEGDERSLRTSALDFEADRWTLPVTIDPHICACCWNRLKVSSDGTLVVLYRDQEPSDMALAVSTDRGRKWDRSGPVGDFDWDFDGCPHVGGGLAIDNSDENVTILATVWTGDAGHAGAHLLRSRDGGGTWDSPPSADSLRAGRNTDVAFLTGNRAVAVWDEPTEGGSRAVFHTMSKDGGLSWSDPQQLSPSGERGTHPRLAATKNGALVVWTRTAGDSSNRLETKRIPASAGAESAALR